MSFEYTLDRANHTIHLTTTEIDAGQIISLARELDARESRS